MRLTSANLKRPTYVSALLLILIIGTLLRLDYVINTEIDDRFYGGLWIGFVDAIKSSSYLLPAEIEELTAAGTPFAYPPLVFYLTALLSDSTGISALTLINLLPGLISISSLFAFYWLTAEITNDRMLKIFAFAGFVFLGSSYEQQQVPAGIAEAAGTLVLILLAKTLFQLRKSPGRKAQIIAGAVGAIALVASPGSAVAMFLTVAAVGICSPDLRRNYRELVRLFAIVVLIALILSTWYWLTNVIRYGPDIFTGTFADRTGDGLFLVDFAKRYLVDLRDLEITGVPLIRALAVVGLVELVRRRQFFVPIWLLLMFSVPREASWLVSIPAGFAIGYGIRTISEVIGNSLSAINPHILKPAAALSLFGLMAIPPLLDVRDSEYAVLSNADIELMQQVKADTEKTALILFVPERSDRGDNFIDWFPHETHRITLNPVGGTEFTLRFDELREAIGDLRQCELVSCVSEAYLLDEGPEEDERYLVVHLGITNDLHDYVIVFENSAGRLIRVP